jgi:hypothetical protein
VSHSALRHLKVLGTLLLVACLLLVLLRLKQQQALFCQELHCSGLLVHLQAGSLHLPATRHSLIARLL